MGNKGITEYVNTELPNNCIRCKTGVSIIKPASMTDNRNSQI